MELIKMISQILRKLIEPYLMIYITEDDMKYIEYMFGECYRTYEDGEEKITLRPPPNGGKLALQFSTINGACNGLAMWDEVQQKGIRI